MNQIASIDLSCQEMLQTNSAVTSDVDRNRKNSSDAGRSEESKAKRPCINELEVNWCRVVIRIRADAKNIVQLHEIRARKTLLTAITCNGDTGHG
jgi:hypothetical protein